MLEEMQKRDVRFDVFSPGRNIVCPGCLFCDYVFETAPNFTRGGGGQQCQQRLDRATLKCFICACNDISWVSSRRLYTREWFSFSGSMKPNQGLKEIPVGQISGLTIQLANRECLPEDLSDCGLILRLHPNQNE